MPIMYLKFTAIALAVGLASGGVPADETKPIPELVGLWKAKKTFGPELYGDLTIEHSNSQWVAEIAGFSTRAVSTGEIISFQFPGDRGGFRGRLDKATNIISGHWTQPKPMQVGLKMVSPVHLTKLAPGRWRGKVTPREGEFTFYMPITGVENGRLKVFLRNPDRNLGIFTNITRVERNGNDLDFIGTFFRRKDERVMVKGVYDPDYDQVTLFLPKNRGGTYDFVRVDDDEASGFYARGKKPGPYQYNPPGVEADGWQVGTLADAGMAQTPLKEMIEKEIDQVAGNVNAHYVHGILIARGGKLVFEEYFHGFHRGVPHDTRSASKSLTAVLIGAAIEANLISGTSLPVYETIYRNALPKNLDPRKARMTLANLLTMTSGYYCDDNDSSAPGNEETMQEQREEPDWYKYTLAVPMAYEPGEKAIYCSSNPNLAGNVLSAATGQRLENLFQELIADPLQVHRYYLILQPSGEPYMGGGIHWMPRDFIKLGQLMLGNGVWNGRRIVSEDWVKKSTDALVTIGDRVYGFQWWLKEYTYRGKTIKAFLAGGNGGQVLIVIPALDLVVNFWGGNYNDRILYKAQDILIPKYILPAVANDAN